MAVVNGVDYGDLGSVSAPSPGTFSSPGVSLTANSSGASIDASTPVVSLWILLGIELFLLACMHRALRRHNGG